MFNGYWINVIKNQKHVTAKYPHCWIGLINNIFKPAFWGSFCKEGIAAKWGKYSIKKPGSSWGRFSIKKPAAFWGSMINDDGGNVMASITTTLNLNSDDFVYDYRDGFNMGVEKNWHVATPVTLDNSVIMYDNEFNELDPSDYSINIFYKLVVPLNKFPDSGIATEDMKQTNTRYGLGNGSPIGTPILNNRGILINKSLVGSGAYKLPDADILNTTVIPNRDFATGTSVFNGWGLDGPRTDRGTKYSMTANWTAEAWSQQYTSGNNFLFMKSGGSTSPGSFVTLDFSTNSVAYTLEISAPLMNIPLNTGGAVNNKLLPELFAPFGLMPWVNEKDPAHAWIYYVLGVTEITAG